MEVNNCPVASGVVERLRAGARQFRQQLTQVGLTQSPQFGSQIANVIRVLYSRIAWQGGKYARIRKHGFDRAKRGHQRIISWCVLDDGCSTTAGEYDRTLRPSSRHRR